MSSDMKFYGFEQSVNAAARIEALEGEVAALKEKLGSGYNTDLNHWRRKFASEHDRSNAADARAERLRVALEGLVEQVADVDTWLRHSDAYEIARKALEDDKPIRAAAGGG